MSAKKRKDTGKRTAAHVKSPHDMIVKNYLGDRETAESLFIEYLPSEITRHMDFSTLEIQKDTFVDKKLSDFYSDLLYRVHFSGSPAYIYLLIEHKSWEEKFLGFQLLKYMVGIWELHLKQNKKVKSLPVILPFVIYHGTKEWRLGNEFKMLFDAPEYVEKYIPNFEYSLQDVSHLPDEEIRGRVLVRILFNILKYIFTPELSHKLPGILRLFGEISDKTKLTEYFEVMLKYLAVSAKNLKDEDLKDSVTKVLSEGGEIMATLAEQWMRQGEERGIQKGIQKNTMDIIKNSLKAGLPIPTIEEITGIPAEEINRLKQKLATP
jgi:predicted transposase/invertase (TIGR01784 family)